MLALTDTADKDTERTVVTILIMRNPVKLFVSPNRTNLRLSVNKVPRTEMLKQLDWLVTLVKQYGKDTPKTIIFGDILYAVASVMNYLMMSLGANAFHPNTSKKRQDCLLGIFHSPSLKEYKDRLLTSFKGDGVKRIAIATTALGMGVNFPNVRYIVLFGPARSLLDFHQQAGRAGRDGQPSVVVVYYYGQQLAHCEDDVRTFLKATGCHRVASYSTLDSSTIPLLPSHDCCNCCAAVCLCNGANKCTSPEKPFEKRSPEETVLTHSRNVSDNQRDFLKGALSEMEASMSCGVGKGVFSSTTFHGFSQELITDVVAKCDRLFTVDDLKTCVPVFSKNHALRILEILNEVFDDIDECTLTDPVNNFYGDEECFFPGLDELFTSSYGDFLEDFSVDPDTIPE